MEALLGLIALLYGLGLPVGVIYLLVKTGRLGRENTDLARRIHQAEQRLQTMHRDAPAEAQTAPVSEQEPEAAARPPFKEPEVSEPKPTSAAADPWASKQAEPPTRAATTDRSRPAAANGSTSARGRPAAPAEPSAFNRWTGQLGSWLVQNWVYAVAAVSLALAGIFLVQYGIENGLLPPTARVLAALAFGAALIGAGEYLRKRWGDGEDSPVAFLPSVFSGAGIISLFAGVLSARHLYDLIGPTTTFAGLLAVAAGAILLGWLTGPLLSALGIVGAFLTPFLLGGSGDASPFVAYLGIVTLVGLAIDTYRRWHWLSVLSLALGYSLIVPLAFADVDPEWVIGFALVMPFAAIITMTWRLIPQLPGKPVLATLTRNPLYSKWPRRMLLLQAMMAGSTIWLVLTAQAGTAEFWLSTFALVILAGGIAIWGRGSAAMEDLPIFPALGTIALVWLEPMLGHNVYRDFIAPVAEGTEEGLRWAPIMLVALSALLGLVAAWRSLTSAFHPRVWAFAAAVLAPAMLTSLEVAWSPASIIGDFPWALTAIALAGLMVLKLERFARAGDEDKMRLSLVLISALGLISFAMMLLLSPSALTVALAFTVLAAVEIDRRFDLPLLEWFAVIGAILVSARLVIHPGLFWADNAPIGQVSFAFVGSILPLAGAWYLARQRDRIKALVTLESAALSLTAIFAAVLLDRWIEMVTGDRGERHWGTGLNALIWLVAASVQAWRLQLGGRLAKMRMVLGGIYAVLAIGYLARGLSEDNPFLSNSEVIHGWPVLSTLTVAYALPAILMLLVTRFMPHLPRQFGLGLLVAGVGLLIFWVVAEIAHFWRGPVLPDMPMRQPELYTYTVAMLMAGAGLLYQAIARQSDLLRRGAMGVIALTVAKVFLVDISGLDGLMRVFSFLALGLSLAGLAWLNRWASMQGKEIQDKERAE
ncbi:DUF2339 domain-containing protein [Aliiroseovarius sp. KMU-50]|uniref:DUF2339 domain-containing protein n=1 Tax=Aliiroseovarius salicola TaxID=3009082 RepID=A0ABT4VYJ7_9RHOB|nr:DUF2339 domain-containing protein [Aliiroseovarius sp. KMU-50]MDA5093341.1 DUF2339 domain-containing protein [Aliiroseovarius sp. KMU-50]